MSEKGTNLIGEIRNNNFGTKMKIIAYRKHSDIDVQFMDEYGYVVHNTTYTNFRKEQIKNPYDPTTYNKGYIGVGKYMAKTEGKVVDSYNTWHDMIRRCYSVKSKDKFSNGKSLGVYDTLEESYAIYSREKERVIQEIANEYMEIIPSKLYDALMEYRVRIDIDKNWVA